MYSSCYISQRNGCLKLYVNAPHCIPPGFLKDSESQCWGRIQHRTPPATSCSHPPGTVRTNWLTLAGSLSCMHSISTFPAHPCTLPCTPTYSSVLSSGGKNALGSIKKADHSFFIITLGSTPLSVSTVQCSVVGYCSCYCCCCVCFISALKS